MKNGPHVLLCSESGTGKSTFASTLIGAPDAEKPVLVQAFDASDKLTPYRKRGTRVEIGKWEYGERELVYRKDVLVAVIERWHEKQGRGSPGVSMSGGAKVSTMRHVLQGQRWDAYLERMKHFVDECEDEWYAYIHDSTTAAEFAVRSFLTGVMKVSDNGLVWGQATDELEHFYMATFPDLPITTIVIAHALPERVVGRDDRGKMSRVRGEPGDVPYESRLPGRLAKDIFAMFGEIYRPYVMYEKGEGGKREQTFYVQTKADGIWRCATQLNVDNPLGGVQPPHMKDVMKKALFIETVSEKGEKA